MSMVERLAKRWADYLNTRPTFGAENGGEVVARWWLLAVADELEAEATRRHPYVAMPLSAWLEAANYLRVEAREDT